MLSQTLSVLVFGILGVAARFGLNEIGVRHLSHPFPTVTFGINVLGSFLIGAISVWGGDLRVPVMVGFLGGFTTFSAFSLETVRLVESRSYGWAALYAIASPIVGIAAAGAGLAAARMVKS